MCSLVLVSLVAVDTMLPLPRHCVDAVMPVELCSCSCSDKAVVNTTSSVKSAFAVTISSFFPLCQLS